MTVGLPQVADVQHDVGALVGRGGLHGGRQDVLGVEDEPAGSLNASRNSCCSC